MMGKYHVGRDAHIAPSPSDTPVGRDAPDAPVVTGILRKTARCGHRALPVILFAVIALLTGCDKNFLPTRGEITSFEIIRVLGIDRAEDGVEVTLIAARAKPAPGEESAGVTHKVMSAAGETAFEAMSKLRSLTDKKQVLGYVDYILVGESAAREDFAKYLDFPARSPEIRYSPKVFIVKGTTAKELLDESGSEDNYIEDSLDNLQSSVDVRSDFSFLKSIDLMNLLDRRDVAAVVPAIELRAPKDEKLIGGELPERVLSPAGYAIVRDMRLESFFGGGDARGYNLLTGKVRTCDYNVPDGEGQTAALHVVSEGMQMRAEFRGDKLVGITYFVRVSAGIAEQHSRIDLSAEAALRALESRLATRIKSDIDSAVKQSKQLGIDCFGLGDRLRMAHPYKWMHIKDDWRGVYGELPITVEVQTRISRVYDLREPSGSKDWSGK